MNRRVEAERWARRETAEGFERVTRELNEERAAALQRIGRRLESLIAEMLETRARLESLSAPRDEERAQAVTAYEDLRREALKYRWYLEVQREAVGLRQHHRLDEFYPIPGPLPR